MPAGYFLLLVQKKVTKEKDTLGDCAGRRAAGSLRATGFDRQAILGLRSNRRDPSRRLACGARGCFRSPFAATLEGPGSEEQRGKASLLS
jgi:hypothetical protein